MPMTEFLSKFDAGETIGLMVVVGGLLCGMVAIVGGIVGKCWCHGRDIAFKDSMLARGMSAEEIQTVMECGPHRLGISALCGGQKDRV